MKSMFKSHISRMQRYQTSEGRDLDNGIRLDRNEKVSNFPQNMLDKIWETFSGYSLSASPDSTSLYQKISETLNIDRDKIFITNGITEGIRVLYDFCTNPGDNVICLDPTFPMYWIYAAMYQVEYRKFSYNPETMLPDLDTFSSQLDRNTRFVFIPNPNLPIESCFRVDEIRTFAETCKQNDTTLVIDEAYHFFGGPSVLDLVDEYENFLVFRTFSKAYGLAGLRLGFMVSQPQNIDYLSKSRSIVESNTLSMQIAEYLIDHPELRDEHIKEVKEGSMYLQEELDKLGLRWYGGNFTNGILIFLKSKEDSDNLVSFLGEKKIYIRGAFEPPFDCCIRVSLGPKPQMGEFIQSLKDLLL